MGRHGSRDEPREAEFLLKSGYKRRVSRRHMELRCHNVTCLTSYLLFHVPLSHIYPDFDARSARSARPLPKRDRRDAMPTRHTPAEDRGERRQEKRIGKTAGAIRPPRDVRRGRATKRPAPAEPAFGVS
ncbi:hypothetical protein [Slackia faecicanis]|uniref:hypothetical protein n=1 Tax=Slackia faecicanis TaxID=255723 RepID=UPI001B869686|nr:hypothetical protein [Slackia faecicanis]